MVSELSLPRYFQ